MKRKIFLLADVDDNLIASARRPPVEGAVPVAWDNRGEVVGYLTPVQKAMLEWFQMGCEVVPTTARSSAAYRRFKLPFRRYGITAFGGTVLGASGRPLKSWQRHIEKDAANARPILSALAESVSRQSKAAGIDVRVSVLNDYGIDMFLSVKHNARNLAELGTVSLFVKQAVPPGWTVHLNGNFLAAYPPFLGKEKAVRWFIDNIVPEGAVVIGMGDSLTDVPFMSLCDYAMMPTASQSFRAFIEALGQERCP